MPEPTPRQYLGSAEPYLTLADERLGYPETRRRLAGYDDAALLRAYRERSRDAFDPMFGHNAATFGNLVVDELLARGITEMPNIFGPIPVRHLRPPLTPSERWRAIAQRPQQARRNHMSAILMIGKPQGLRLVGPFKDSDAAENYAKRHHEDDEWTVASLEFPGLHESRTQGRLVIVCENGLFEGAYTDLPVTQLVVFDFDENATGSQEKYDNDADDARESHPPIMYREHEVEPLDDLATEYADYLEGFGEPASPPTA